MNDAEYLLSPKFAGEKNDFIRKIITNFNYLHNFAKFLNTYDRRCGSGGF